MPYAKVNDILMYYEEQGQGEPLVLLPTLAARYRTFSLEHRGHGRTDNPANRLSYAQMAADVAAFIEHSISPPLTSPASATARPWVSPLA